jgi:hypothetical protein
MLTWIIRGCPRRTGHGSRMWVKVFRFRPIPAEGEIDIYILLALRRTIVMCLIDVSLTKRRCVRCHRMWYYGWLLLSRKDWEERKGPRLCRIHGVKLSKLSISIFHWWSRGITVKIMEWLTALSNTTHQWFQIRRSLIQTSATEENIVYREHSAERNVIIWIRFIISYLKIQFLRHKKHSLFIT